MIAIFVLIGILLISSLVSFIYESGQKKGRESAFESAKSAAMVEVRKKEQELIAKEQEIQTEKQKVISFAAETKQQLAKSEALLDEKIKLRYKEADARVAFMREGIQKLKSDTLQTYPWLATLYADYVYTYDKNLSNALLDKTHPAPKAAESVAEISREKREWIQRCKMHEYQLRYYETLFPWLEEFKLIDPMEAYDIVQNVEVNEDDALGRHLLSPNEYTSLASAEKFQLALDRYCKQKKSAWQIGIDYERYIGYLFEKDGYEVKYTGATFGLEDRGRDLIVSNDDLYVIIQCKRWSQSKTIHEKHIFQLFGSLVSWEIENNKTASAAFFSTCELSDVAQKCATHLGIQVVIKQYEPYPMIKCNLSRSGEKIYHLPFDQQYDRVFITPSRGDCYASTIIEAQELGFRRAFRWKSTSDSN